jgi:capsular exopolysaccharide synthesis family protein
MIQDNTEFTFPETQSDSSSVNVRDLCYLCLSRWYLFVISLLLTLGIAVFVIKRTAPLYTRSAAILIKDDTKKPDATGGVTLSDFERGGETLGDKSVTGPLNSVFSTPLGRIAVSPTVAFPEERSYQDILVSHTCLYNATDAFKGRFSAALSSKDATVINLTYQDVSTERAADALSMLIKVYNEKWLEDRNRITVSTSKFITGRLGVIEHELGDVDEDISSYKSAHLLPDADAATSLNLQQSQTTDNEILNLETQLAMARYIRNHVTGTAGKNKLIPANCGLENTSIEKQIADYNTMQLQRNSLVSNSSDKNPIVSDLDRSLSELRRAIITSLDNLVLTLNTRISALEASARHTTSQIASNPNQEKYLQTVGRQQKVKEALYLFLLQKREENELSRAFTACNTRLITPPTGNMSPIAPQKGKIMLIAFFIGLVLPVGGLVLRENMNRKVRGREDLERVSIPFVGEIPVNSEPGNFRLFGKHNQRQPLSVVVKSGSRDMINEAFRVLRTNVEFVAGEVKSSNVMIVTSFNSGSGKSFISANVAAGLALEGKKVLVIDGDLRRGTLSHLVGRPKKGLSNYLAGYEEEISPLILPYRETDNLYILPIGTFAPNPTELLYSERFGELIGKLRVLYDYVLIDCPPVEIVADTQIIEKQADRTLFVARARHAAGTRIDVSEEEVQEHDSGPQRHIRRRPLRLPLRIPVRLLSWLR